MENMLVGKQTRKSGQLGQRAARVRTAADARRRRSATGNPSAAGQMASHPFTHAAENTRLYKYESLSKEAFDKIEPALREIAQYQHDSNFVAKAQEFIKQQLGLDLPEHLLENAWIKALDMGALYAWCVFETFQQFADKFYNDKPLAQESDADFQRFIESCGFHTLDFSPCADGRLAHAIRYVMRLPHKGVRRKSYAGAMFDVEDSLQKWVAVEHKRLSESVPNSASAPTRYLKTAVYHYSSSLPDHEGCAAHGSDAGKAADGAMSRLLAFQQGVQNSFCCGASIDLMLIGIDTDNDAIRIHFPNAEGQPDGDNFIDARDVYDATYHRDSKDGVRVIKEMIEQKNPAQSSAYNEGLVKLMARILFNNISQIDYVRNYFKGCYSDIGHQERFIGMGVGFEEVQLRNLTYFAYLKTVEQGATDVDVGIKIFTGLNIKRGLPAPIVIRYDYHGNVPGARDRAVGKVECLNQALRARFRELSDNGMIHTLQVIRDCNAGDSIEVVGSSLGKAEEAGH
jgi:carboxysome shell carbonic anhydrase